MHPTGSDELPTDQDLISDQPVSTELLLLCDKFFRTATNTVHDELRQFLVQQGLHPVTSLSWFLDSLAFTAYRHQSG